jgi:hypothetical protein
VRIVEREVEFPYIPITPSIEGNMAFLFVETGEILEFHHSYRQNLDAVERILWQNYTGDYIAYYPQISDSVIGV